MILGVAWILFLIFLLPHVGSIPYLDGNIDLVQAYDFYTGGFVQLADRWGSLHPPLKVFVVSTLFRLFGVHTWSYVVLGVIAGLVGISAMYGLARELFGRKVAGIAGIFIATSPLFLSVGIFALTDYLLTVWALMSLLMYAKKQYIWCSVFLAFSVLTKETALLLPFSIVVVEIGAWIAKKRVKRLQIIPIIAACSSFVVYAFWSNYLHGIGQRPWSDWIFTDTADKGAMYTTIHNVLTGRFINPYAKQNWLHLFVLNYIWLYGVFAAVGVMQWLMGVRIRQKEQMQRLNTHRVRAFTVYLIFGLMYAMFVLSFQTYTIPRYVLPVMPLILLSASWSIDILVRKWHRLQIPLFVLFVCIGVLALFTSSDPISRVIWGDTTWMGERLYNLRDHLSGNDGITYNMQYLSIVRERTRLIVRAQKDGRSIMSSGCSFLFPDPNNEKKLLDIFQFNRIPKDRWCTMP